MQSISEKFEKYVILTDIYLKKLLHQVNINLINN